MKRRGPGSRVRGPERLSGEPQPRLDPEAGARTPVPQTSSGRLFVVATPIGNLGDLSSRARDVLASSTLVLAEDTRRVRQLLSHFGLATPTRSLHEHNEADEVPRLIARLAAGETLALVSDAGTPLLADPGFRLVRACRGAGVPVFTVPGPSAVTAALSVSGLPPYPFTFAGFLPAAPSARRRTLESLAPLPHTLVLFLSPHRLTAELATCAEVLGADREAALLAELTKVHERCRRGSLAALAARDPDEKARGEHTLVVGPPLAPEAASVSPDAAREALSEALGRGLPLPEARREAARRLGISRRELYDLLRHTPEAP
jgi:16S rRNA (cytidine1402-2'-O)-methyltransferase